MTGDTQIILEGDASGNTVVSHGYGLAVVTLALPAPICRYEVAGAALVRYLTDRSGDIIWRSAYNALGIQIRSTDNTASNCVTGQWNSDLGLYYLRAGYLNPNIGRFWTMDTYEGDQEDPQSLHKYAYCQSDPVNNTDLSGHEIEGMLAVMDISSIFAAILSPATSKSVTAAPVDYKLKVVHGHTLIDWFVAAGVWGQPAWCARGDYSVGTYTATSWVWVRSRNNNNGSCNTMNNLDPSGTIILFMRTPSPRSIQVYANVRWKTEGTGPQRGTAIKVLSYLDPHTPRVLANENDRGGSDLQDDRPFVFDSYVSTEWTPVLKYIPTIGFSVDYGRRSTGRASGTIIYHGSK